jgi:hypothetical protein
MHFFKQNPKGRVTPNVLRLLAQSSALSEVALWLASLRGRAPNLPPLGSIKTRRVPVVLRTALLFTSNKAMNTLPGEIGPPEEFRIRN